MSRKTSTLGSMLYYLAFAVAGCVSFALDSSWFGQGMLVCMCAMAIFGILNYVSFECLLDSTFFHVVRIIICLAAFLFCALVFFSGYITQYMDAVTCSFGDALKHAVVLFPLAFMLIRTTVYRFSAETLEETGNFIITLVLPLVSYVVSVVILTTHVVWGFLALFLVWLVVNIFIKGRLNGFERFLFNLAYYGSFLAIGLSFAGKNVFATMAFVAASFCFFLFIGIDLFEESDSAGYWIFNVIGMLGGLVFSVVALVTVDMGNFEGIQAGIRFGFGDALKNAWLFMPLVFLCLRPALYKLAKESEWEEGLGDVFVSLLLPVISYFIAVAFLLIGFSYTIVILAVGLTITFVIWACNDAYPQISDKASAWREAADVNITITITWGR